MAVGPDREDRIAAVEGIRLGAVESHIRYAKRLDLVLVDIAEGSTTAGVFTQNAFCAAPVRIRKNMLRQLQVAIF